MIELHKFPPNFGLRDASPFCLKLFTYLRLSGIPHTVVESVDSRTAPKQKFPYIVDEGNVFSDSELIIAHIKNKYGDPLADGLDNGQLAVGHAFSTMLAERFYWVLVHDRWLDKKHQALIRDAWFSSVPGPFRGLVARHVTKSIKSTLNGHGIGRHSAAEIHQLGISDIDAVEAHLGDKPYFLDDRPREVDASIYAFLSNAACELFPTPVCDRVRSSAKLMAYIDRVDHAAFGDGLEKMAA